MQIIPRCCLPFALAVFAALVAIPLHQPAGAASTKRPDRVLTLGGSRDGPHSLAVDRGAPGLWQQLLRLRTTASVLYTAGHPDDEQGGTLAYLSRGRGVRTALLTLTRGEGGANAIGSELFDALGLVRTEELLVSDRYYGLDDQYFTDLIDYGYSKNLEEALGQWGRDNVLREIVRVIRINRPLVLVSRFYGDARDGHGNHEVSGVVTREAFAAAGDPGRFPAQIEDEGLRPWQPLKLYRSNLRSRRSGGTPGGPPDHRWNVAIDAGEFSPWLGQTYEEFASEGLSFQRSQTSGRRRERLGAHRHYFERIGTRVETSERETGFFEGIDTSITGILGFDGAPPKDEAVATLAELERAVEDSISAYSVQNPSATVPFLVQGLRLTRDLVRLCSGREEATFLLRIKEHQFQEAIGTALGLQFRALAAPPGSTASPSAFSAQSTMGPAVPGQQFRVEASLVNPSRLRIEIGRVSLQGSEAWDVVDGEQPGTTLHSGMLFKRTFGVSALPDANPSRRYYRRESVRDSRYRILEQEFRHLPARDPALVAVAEYSIGGQSVSATAVVHHREANLPYGYELRELRIAPALAVNVSPRSLIVPLGSAESKHWLEVELLNNRDSELRGDVTLDVPDGWLSEPSRQPFRIPRSGVRQTLRFAVTPARLDAGEHVLQVVATVDGREYREGYESIRQRDLDVRHLYRDASTVVHGIDVRIAQNLAVGYVMGVGDEVPAAIGQLGAEVTLLGGHHLADGDLGAFDAIVVGTRAYAVRQDLIRSNQRLLDYVRDGGNLVVLYQTPEFVPGKWAPFPADLPTRAEEVSEEDAPVRILADDHPVFLRPNRIVDADFDGWVEQRGSKFFASWDTAYLPLIETHDQGQEPQQGGWLVARYGEGHYTYFAYAIHRQVPYGVPGPYRILANLLSLGR